MTVLENLAEIKETPDRHRAALEYAAAGIPVFPCRVNRKKPAVAGGFHSATTDPTVIDALWGEADYNIAFEPESAGLCVVDLDGDAGRENWEALCVAHCTEPYATRMAITPSGGRHLYYRGSLPSTASKLAPKIDTRGRGGYVLLPPSYVVEEIKGYEGPYEWLDSQEQPADLPEWVAERLAHAETTARAAPEGVELDTELAVAEAISWIQHAIKRGGPPVEGDYSDDRTYKIAQRVKDQGISAERCLDLLTEHWAPHFDTDWLEAKVESAYKNGQNQPGADAIPWSVAEMQAMAEAIGWTPANEPPAQLTSRFRGRWPDEYEALPPLEFWDDDKTLPRSPDGCIAILYAEFGSGKTNTVLTMLLDAVFDRGARVCYAAGEGAYGVGKDRLPAHCAVREKLTKELRGRFRVVPAMPLFSNPADVNEFIEAQRDLRPNIIVLDTLATAIAGEDENSSKAAAYLTANGAAGWIRDAYKALVIVLAHSGKDSSKGVRGHSGFGGNADVILHLEADKAAGAIKLTVEKMRDGRDDFSVYFRYDKGGVPVPRRISSAEYTELVAARGDAATPAMKEFNRRYNALCDAGARSFETGLSESAFAALLVGPEPIGGTPEEYAAHDTKIGKTRKALQNAHSTKTYKGVLCDEKVPVGGGKMEWRWFANEIPL
jgi:hypothetical protein